MYLGIHDMMLNQKVSSQANKEVYTFPWLQVARLSILHG